MADPLSIAASIVTLISAGSVIGMFLAKIVALRNAPAILLALCNDVADLDRLVRTVETLLREHSEVMGVTPIEGVSRALEGIKETLLWFQTLVLVNFSKTNGIEGGMRLNRWAWLQSDRKLNKLKDQIRDRTAQLSFAVQMLTQ